MWRKYRLPERLDGLRVLDVGAWDGRFSFEAERRGAASVTAMDVWDRPDPGSNSGGLDNLLFCKAALGSKVEPVAGSVYELADKPKYGLILFLQVLYHLQDPLRALHRLRGAVADGGMVCLETWLDAEWIGEPAAIFYPGSELAGEPTNWWGPNAKCVEGMARAAGFACEMVWSEKEPAHFGGRGKRACFHLRPR